METKGDAQEESSSLTDRLMSTDGNRSMESTESEASRILDELGKIGIEHQFDVEEQPAYSKSYSKTKRRACIFGFGSIFLIWLAVVGLYANRSLLGSAHASHLRRLTMDDVQSSKFQPRRRDVQWMNENSIFERSQDGKITIIHVASGTSTDFLDSKIRLDGEEKTIQKFWVNEQSGYALLATDMLQNWRHSFFARYYIYSLHENTTIPLLAKEDMLVIFAELSPSGQRIAYIKENDLYVYDIPSNEHTRVSHDGAVDFFNGVPDWVYEEEIFQTNSALWWSPDSRYIAFLSTNDSSVLEFPIPYFLENVDSDAVYPKLVSLKYPKPGSPNPTIETRLYDVMDDNLVTVSWDGTEESKLIAQVFWTGKDKFMVREFNRPSDFQRMIVVDAVTGIGQSVREENMTAIDGGWFEVRNSIHIPANSSQGRVDDGYLDVIVHDGFEHLAYFSPLTSTKPLMLTSGPYQITDGQIAPDLDRGIVYFQSTQKNSVERHLYSVRLDGSNLQAVTDTSQEAYYDVAFAPGAKHALISYQGPETPWQKMYDMETQRYILDIELNLHLANASKEYDLPTKVVSTLRVDGRELNVEEIRPPRFDSSHKHPLLFKPYGGPMSQTVAKKWGIDVHSFLAASRGYVVVTVDGRGTGFKGRDLETAVRGHLGRYEAADQISAAKILAERDYIDEEHLAIWGWSFGGYLTLKVLETDQGETFQYGVAVAPVTDFHFYDSVYTERYMMLPSQNEDGYKEAAVSNATAVGQAGRFLIMHGTGDDNVHFQNTLVFLDRLDEAGVENYDVHVFPDSHHSITFHNANRMVYDRLVTWLDQAFSDVFA